MKPLPLPGRLDRPPRRARHGERPRHAGSGAYLAVGSLRHRGGVPGRASCGRSPPTWPRLQRAAGVSIVTGDTKVVGRGAADGLFITTAGVGVIPPGRELGPERVRPGDVVLVSGTIADHGMAVMLARGDLALEADIRSDTAPLGGLTADLLAAAPATRWLRDPTRGGVGTVCNELAHDSGFGVALDENALPLNPAVVGACDLLGIDPLYVANEGKLIAVVDADEADAALEAMHAHPLGASAARIGEIVADPVRIVVLRTTFGGTRIVDMLVGDPLPRIC